MAADVSDGGDKTIQRGRAGGERARRARSGFSSKPTWAGRGASQGGRVVLGVTAPERGRSHPPDPGQGAGPRPPSHPAFQSGACTCGCGREGQRGRGNETRQTQELAQALLIQGSRSIKQD